ncbi:MAG: septum formation initiator family protein [Acidimicrobiia bacterium]|nr:septum formation initiator family protein [Acidimicrobiia bacterium]
MTQGPTPRYTPEQVSRRRAIMLRTSVALVIVVGLLFVVVFPVRALLDQRGALDQSQHQLEVLRQERQRLEREAKQLQADAEVERVAREDLGMVRPGEQAYAPVPGVSTTTTSSTLPLAP